MSQSSSGSQGSGANRSDFVPPSVEDLDAVLDAYEFIEILGRGGMGAVYKARQITLDRLVAIKILPQMDDDNDEFHFSERFQREARAMARLSHPNIIGVIDFGQTSDGQLYIVMEYVEGTDLHVLIRGGQLTTEHIFGWMPQICDAMQYAHSQGIVHRDIKPANIMINTGGVVKIADFGLAKLGDIDSQTTRLTMTNVAMGTPDYVAPEVLEEGIEPDHRADLYAVGVMIYEMLTGKIPRGAWRAPSSLKPDLDPRFDELVIHAMDADPDTRFQHASEISSQLTSIHTTRPVAQIATPGGAKLNLPASDTAPVSPSAAAASSSTGMKLQSPPSSAADLKQQQHKSKTGLIIGGSVAACLVAAGLAAWLMRDGNNDGSGSDTQDSSIDLAANAGSASTLLPTDATPPAAAPDEPAMATPRGEPAPADRKPSLPAPAPAPSGDTNDPEAEPKPDPAPETESTADPATATAESGYAGPPLLPVRRAIHLHSGDRPQLEVQNLKYSRDNRWTFELWISAGLPENPMTMIAGFDGVSMVGHIDNDGTKGWHVGFIGVMGTPIRIDQPQHLAFQGDGEFIEIFVDGVSAGKGPISGIPDGERGRPLVIGSGTKGYYDEIRFSKVTRYHGNFIPQRRFEADHDTLALWHFDDLSDEVATDSSGNGHDIQLANFQGWSWADHFYPESVHPGDPTGAIHQRQQAWAEHYGVPVEFENSIGMKFRLIPGGSFVKGNQNNSDTSQDHPLYFGVHEVTQAEFEEIAGESKSSFREGGRDAEAVTDLDTRTHPVETCGVFDAARFCNELSEREGLVAAYRTDGFKITAIEEANGYRLATSEEWEYACRGGTTSSFFDGTDSVNYTSLERFARAGKRTYPVGEKLANDFGLHDMQGNVCELVNGKYGSNWTAFEPVVRFGGFRRNRSVNSWASWMQEEVPWKHKNSDLGFRIVLPSLLAVAEMPEDREIKTATPPHPAGEQLTQLEQQIRGAFSEKIETPYQTALQRLREQFRNALSQRASNAQGQAKALFQTELDRFSKGEALPDDDSGLPPAIVQLRKTWRQQNAKLLADRKTAFEGFWPGEAAKLQRATAQFDKQGLTFFAGQSEAVANRLRRDFLREEIADGTSGSLTREANRPSSNTPVSPNQKVDWVPLFDSNTLDNWTATGSARSFSIDRDAIKASGEPGFLYYTGDVFYGARFRDFDFKAQVKSEGGANSGIFFHVAKSSEAFPSQGYEVQIHNGGQDPDKTGSLVGIAKAEGVAIPEGEWFDLEISVRGRVIITRVNGKEVVTHQQPADWQPPEDFPGRRISEGTFALQCHFPESGATWFRDIAVRPYKDPLTLEVEVAPGSIERSPPDPSELPKGRLYAFGVDSEGKPFDLKGLDRGNDFVDVEIRPDFWTALRSRGMPVSSNPYWGNYAKERFAKVGIGSSGEPGILKQDGTLFLNAKPPVVWPPDKPIKFVDVTGGYNSFCGLGEDGQVYLDTAPHYISRLAPLGSTDIIKIAQWHSTLWCLRSNGQLVWCGGNVDQASLPPAEIGRHRIVDVVADSAGIALALSDKGQALLWAQAEFDELSPVPESTRTDISQIRAGWGGKVAAVRKKNGKWIAWGSDKFGVVSKINSLGPEVVEMAFTESQLLWIE